MSTQTEQLLTKEWRNTPSIKTTFLQTTMEDKMNCSFDRWYEQFHKHCMKSFIIPLNDTFVAYLKEDGLKLPPQLLSNIVNTYDPEQKEELENEEMVDFIKLDDIFDEINKILNKPKWKKVGIFPKLNWSAPKDAKWINSETLVCHSIEQILLLLKASQFIQMDVEMPFANCIDFHSTADCPSINYYLILRKYHNIHQCREFRCFVFHHKLIAISQRNDGYFDELQSQSMLKIMQENIVSFFDQNIRKLFINDNYVMDVYINERMKIYLIDFNPFYEITDAILFTWMDICLLCQKFKENGIIELEMRVVRNEQQLIAFSSHSQYRYPVDAVDLTSKEQIEQFVNSCAKHC